MLCEPGKRFSTYSICKKKNNLNSVVFLFFLILKCDVKSCFIFSIIILTAKLKICV